MPRPPSPEHKKRRERRVYMTDDDWRVITDAAAAADQSVSTFVRDAALRAAAKVAKEDAEAREAARRRR